MSCGSPPALDVSGVCAPETLVMARNRYREQAPDTRHFFYLDARQKEGRRAPLAPAPTAACFGSLRSRNLGDGPEQVSGASSRYTPPSLSRYTPEGRPARRAVRIARPCPATAACFGRSSLPKPMVMVRNSAANPRATTPQTRQVPYVRMEAPRVQKVTERC